MTKENVLFSAVGLLLGFIVGFMFANSANQQGVAPRTLPPQVASSNTATQSSNLPPDHPSVTDQQGMQKAAEEAIQQARNEPTNFDAQMKAAAFYYQIRRYNEAIEFLLKANQLRPDDVDTITALGSANLHAGNNEAAERWYTAALIKKPDDIDARTALGFTFLFRNPPDLDRAIKEFRSSLERDPRHEDALQHLALALIQKGNVKEAQATLAKLEEVNPSNPALSDLRTRVQALSSSSSDSKAPRK
jgi:tetratricopeptide (TPR) repeat protein